MFDGIPLWNLFEGDPPRRREVRLPLSVSVTHGTYEKPKSVLN